MNLNLNDPKILSNQLNTATKDELTTVIRHFMEEAEENETALLTESASFLREAYYGKRVFFRGLIEFSNYCKNDCYYCGIRKSNKNAHRYRLSEEEIFDCCKTGYDLGFRTFVLQGGEDPYFNDDRLSLLIAGIKERFSDAAITLSLGERSHESYRRLYDAGADRYLLRHETADEEHYHKLHPLNMSLKNRKECLYDLKAIGFQVGAGFMVDSPYQTYETLAEDLIFLRELNPNMVGIGPFIPHKDTCFAAYYEPSTKRTLRILSLVRIMLPKVLLPATTALGTIDPLGREKGLKEGANVVMPNLSPTEHRKDYDLYDNKICTGDEAAECLRCLTARIKNAGFVPDFGRGDHVDWQEK